MKKTIPLGLLLAGALGCAGAQHPASASTDWVRVTTDHFTLSTDESPKDALKIATYLEQTRSALLSAAWPRAQLTHPDRADVVVLSSDNAFEQLFGRNVDGMFFGRGRGSTMVLHGNPDHWEQRDTLSAEGSNSVLKHETVHRLANALGIPQPRWLAEGMAEFLETTQVSPDGKSAQIGLINLRGLQFYKRFRSVGVKDALEWSGPIDEYDELGTAARYGISWAMVQWMYNEHPDAFARYQVAVVKGANPTEAWTVAFPNLTPEQADKEIFQYLSHGGYHVFTVQIPPASAVAPKEQALGSADVHALQAKLDFAAAGARADGRSGLLEDGKDELAAALKDDPGNVAALQMMFTQSKPDQRQAIAQRATQAHPESEQAWIMLGESMGDSASPEQQAAFLKAAALAPEDPEPLNNLAWGRVTHGQAAQALPYALKAAHLAPADPEVLDTLAAAYAGLGRCQDAVATETRAIGFLPEQASGAEGKGYQERLDKMKSGCTQAAPPSSTPAAPASTSAK